MRFSLKQKKRSAVSPVIATLLLIAIAVAAAIIVYAFVTGLIGGLTSSGASLVVVSGSMTIPSGSGSGSLIVTVNNKASNAINAITIASTASDGAVLSVTFLAQNGGVAAGTINGVGTVGVLCGSLSVAQLAAITAGECAASAPANSVAIGSSASAVGTVTVGASAGTTYTFVVSSYIGSSTTPNLQSFSVTAQI
jgi:flagellin-like protein